MEGTLPQAQGRQPFMPQETIGNCRLITSAGLGDQKGLKPDLSNYFEEILEKRIFLMFHSICTGIASSGGVGNAISLGGGPIKGMVST